MTCISLRCCCRVGLSTQNSRGDAALGAAIDSDDELLVTSAARALNNMSERDWIVTARGKLRGIQNTVLRGQLAAILAEVGDFGSWFAIRNVVSDPSADEVPGADVVELTHNFAEMPGPEGSRLILASELNETAVGVSEHRRQVLFSAIRRVQTSRAAPKRQIVYLSRAFTPVPSFRPSRR